MFLLIRTTALALVVVSVSASAQERAEAPSLADEAALLADKGGWDSGVVALSRNEGKTTARGKLSLVFGSVARGKTTGLVSLRIDMGTARLASPGSRFELVEKDDRRYLQILAGPPGDKAVPNAKLLASLEYTRKGDVVTLKGGVVPKWAGWDVDFSRPISFKASGK